VKVFVLNNRGYHSIRQTQANFFAGHTVGCGPESGVTFPDFAKLAEAFGFRFNRCATHAELAASISAALAGDGPSLCEVVLDLRQPFAPRVSSRRLDDGRIESAPLHDMAPFLSREELASNMLWESDGGTAEPKLVESAQSVCNPARRTGSIMRRFPCV